MNKLVRISCAFGSTYTFKDLQSKTVKKRMILLKSSNNAATEATQPMKLVFVSAEIAPWSKSGGLGDVVGALPIELASRGHRVMTVAPRYDQYSDAWDTSVMVDIDGYAIRYFHTVEKGVDRAWVDHPMFLAKVRGLTGSMLYGKSSGADYSDNQKRFGVFCKSAIEATRVLPFGPGECCTFIANDWHSALVPVLIKDVYQPRGEFEKAKVAFCVHNVAFQGRFWRDSFNETGLPLTSLDKFMFEDGCPMVFEERNPASDFINKKLREQTRTGKKFAKINWMKAGIISSDKNLTVSPNYAKEITSGPSHGVELDHVFRAHGLLEGIVNGMDITEWNPYQDKYLPLKYNKENMVMGKAAAKAALQAELGFPAKSTIPLFGFIGRLEEQKGVDILLAAIKAVTTEEKIQIVVLGTGKKEFETATRQIENSAPKVAKGVVKFSAPLAHMITAGCDFIVVPSRFEPWGLIQLHAMTYGTVPLVSSTGGLVDTVKEGVTGFHMGAMDLDTLKKADVDSVAATIARAAKAYGSPQYRNMSLKCINQDLSWNKPAKRWEAILEELSLGNPKVEKKSEVQVPAAAVS
jgi:granule-bound starch synthase